MPESRVEGCSISDFLKTKEALDLYSRLLELIKSFAHTTHARDKLNLFYPFPASRMDLDSGKTGFCRRISGTGICPFREFRISATAFQSSKTQTSSWEPEDQRQDNPLRRSKKFWKQPEKDSRHFCLFRPWRVSLNLWILPEAIPV